MYGPMGAAAQQRPRKFLKSIEHSVRVIGACIIRGPKAIIYSTCIGVNIQETS